MDDVAMLSARIEAMLDFSDEDDVASDAAAFDAIRRAVDALADRIAGVVDAPPVERLKDGIRVVIGGPPNSGKSTLLNLMGERDAAIVSAISGTTRDRIDVPVMRGGIAYVLTDTAGLIDTLNPIEAIGVTRAEQAITTADILVWLADTAPPRADAIWVHARADLAGRDVVPEGRAIAIAQTDPASIDRLWDELHRRADALLPRSDGVALKAHQRRQCAAAIATLRETSGDPLIVAEHLRRARSILAEVLGLDATGEMLDALFGRFCIGK
jgi:tRNA modification GTPase